MLLRDYAHPALRERGEDLKKRIREARLEGISYEEALQRFHGEYYIFERLYSSKAEWDHSLLARDLLEHRWPQATFECVRVLPVPEHIVKDRW